MKCVKILAFIDVFYLKIRAAEAVVDLEEEEEVQVVEEVVADQEDV